MATTFLDLLRVKVAIQLGALDTSDAVAGLKKVDGGSTFLDYLQADRGLPDHTVRRIDRHAQRCMAIKGESVYVRLLRERKQVSEEALVPIMWEVRAQQGGPGLGATLVQQGLLPAADHEEILTQTTAALEQENTTTATRYRERNYEGVERVSPMIAQLIKEEAESGRLPRVTDSAPRPATPPPLVAVTPPLPSAPPLPAAPPLPSAPPLRASGGEGTQILSREQASGATPLPGELGRPTGPPILDDIEVTAEMEPPEELPLPPQLEGSGLDAKYHVLRKLGEGGMGQVFLAYAKDDPRRERPIALKVVLDRAKSRDAEERFKREILATSMCGHRNIIEIYDAAETNDGSYYMAMEYLEGDELSDLLKAERQIALPRVVDLMEQALEGLEALHQADIVHRDIKPHNFRITRDDEGKEFLKIVDFGIARILGMEDAGLGDQIFTTMAGKITGSPAYIAPESITEPVIDARADLYSLGISIFRIATGRLPFVAKAPTEYLPMHLYQKPPLLRSCLPNAPSEFEELVSKLLEKLPRNRFQTAGETLEFMRTKVRPAVFSSAPPSAVAATAAASAPPPLPTPVVIPAGPEALGFSTDQDFGFTQPTMPVAEITMEVAAPADAASPQHDVAPADPQPEAQAQKPGFFSRMWRAIFGSK